MVLVLQGGGALAPSGGRLRGDAQAGIEPDWVIGTSIGAVNGAIITGNLPADRLARLRKFWESVENDSPPSQAVSARRRQVLLTRSRCRIVLDAFPNLRSRASRSAGRLPVMHRARSPRRWKADHPVGSMPASCIAS